MVATLSCSTPKVAPSVSHCLSTTITAICRSRFSLHQTASHQLQYLYLVFVLMKDSRLYHRCCCSLHPMKLPRRNLWMLLPRAMFLRRLIYVVMGTTVPCHRSCTQASMGSTYAQRYEDSSLKEQPADGCCLPVVGRPCRALHLGSFYQSSSTFAQGVTFVTVQLLQ